MMISLMAAAMAMTSEPQIRLNPTREFRGVWVATVDNIDWPTKKTLPVEAQKAELERIVEVCSGMNVNAIIFQVRPQADSLYESKIEPWSEYLTGQEGKAPEPKWDPLAHLIDIAHEKGIEVHAWFNPYRAKHFVSTSANDPSHITQTNPASAPQYGRYKWMNPADPLVQRRTKDVMLDVAKRYAVDGVHIDDYFYPYPEKGPDGKSLDFPDQASYDAYQKSGGQLGRDSWRRHQVDNFVETFYAELKKQSPWVKFGISPFGIYRPGVPKGITAGIDQYATLYADCLKWYHEGWCDYYTPQLYWPTTQKAQAYEPLLRYWVGENRKSIHFWPGNYTGQVGTSKAWTVDEVLEQIDLTRKRGAGGNVHFSMKVFTANKEGITDALTKGPYAAPALVPSSPWLGKQVPKAPVIRTKSSGVIDLKPMKDEDARFFVIADNTGRIHRVTAATASEIRIPAAGELKSVYCAAMSRTGILSSWVKVDF